MTLSPCYAAAPDDYDALYTLREFFEPHTEKRIIIDFLIAEEERVEEEVVKF